jgi:hydroxyacylglutathione hydrolase
MLIERIWPDNRYLNFHYLIACPESGEALAVDPLDWRLTLNVARRKGWDITQVLNTHEHTDHSGGNLGMIGATGAKLLAHVNAARSVQGIDVGLKAGDLVRVGRTVELKCLDTPGHTMAHICLFEDSDEPSLFCGDTLFNAGVGNCHNGGDPTILYHTFASQIASLPDTTRVYSGHDYLLRNLAFTLDREPSNQAAALLLRDEREKRHQDVKVTTLGEEKLLNTFFRLQNPIVIKRLQDRFPDLGERPDELTVFKKLRELRNEW